MGLCAAGLVLLVSAAPALASEDDFAQYLERFRGALARVDAGAIADLTRLPFLYESAWRDRAAFERIVPELFDAPVRACLARTGAIVEDDARVIFCPPYAFYFRRATDGGWRLEEFGVDGEDAP